MRSMTPKLIAHRALIDGPNQALENHPAQIELCLQRGFDVEIDLWSIDAQFWLGHDQPQYQTNLGFLSDTRLWIHVKNHQAAFEMLKLTRSGHQFNFFWHENDQRVLTSMGYWWTFPGQQLGSLSVAVMPEIHTAVEQLPVWFSQQQCFAVCSDYVGRI